ncbi:MAG: hypothetical protein ACRCY3_02655 [Sphingorhabdus sp.]
MEARILAALVLIAMMIVGGGWFILRKIGEKRAFEYRQSGRGKDSSKR